MSSATEMALRSPASKSESLGTSLGRYRPVELAARRRQPTARPGVVRRPAERDDERRRPSSVTKWPTSVDALLGAAVVAIGDDDEVAGDESPVTVTCRPNCAGVTGDCGSAIDSSGTATSVSGASVACALSTLRDSCHWPSAANPAAMPRHSSRAAIQRGRRATAQNGGCHGA